MLKGSIFSSTERSIPTEFDANPKPLHKLFIFYHFVLKMWIFPKS